MLIRRDYSQPFFGNRKRRRGGRRLVLILFLVIGIAGGIALTQFDRLQLAALNALNMAPTSTPGPSELISRARALRGQGDLSAAAVVFEQALASRPDDVGWMYEYGLLLMDLEDYAGAVEQGDKAIAADVYDPRGYALKARGLVWQEDSSTAIPVALTGLNVDGQFAPLYAMLARAYTLSGNIRAGIENAEKGVAVDPNDPEAHRALAFSLNYAADYDIATAELETAMALEPANVSIALELAYQYLSLNRDEEAIDLYSTVLRLQPRNARAMLRLCLAYRKVGQFDEAMTQCENAVRADPNYTAAHFRLGLMRYSEPYRDFNGAQQAFDACVSLDPSNIECLFRLGLTYYYQYLAGGDPASLCAQAWDLLSQSEQMTGGRPGIEDTLADIQTGLEHVARDCPGGFNAMLLGITPVYLDEPPSTAEPGE